jgi:predicted RNA-binding Zn-ribbon protein involved in translation (DUF1610 family)|tara:strand:- start:64 stop:402 length:339 start_codon:yes stop_codon:yes gene_type:complete
MTKKLKEVVHTIIKSDNRYCEFKCSGKMDVSMSLGLASYDKRELVECHACGQLLSFSFEHGMIKIERIIGGGEVFFKYQCAECGFATIDEEEKELECAIGHGPLSALPFIPR